MQKGKGVPDTGNGHQFAPQLPPRLICLPSTSYDLREGYKRAALLEIVLCAKQQWSLYSQKDE